MIFEFRFRFSILGLESAIFWNKFETSIAELNTVLIFNCLHLKMILHIFDNFNTPSISTYNFNYDLIFIKLTQIMIMQSWII